MSQPFLRKDTMPMTDEEMKVKLEEYFAKEEVITRKELQIYCNLTKSTATRTLKRLAEQGILRNVSTDRNPVYMLNK